MIVSTENALLSRLRALFGNTLRNIVTYPGDWSKKGLRDVLLTLSSMYLVWLGAQAGQVKGVIDSRFQKIFPDYVSYPAKFELH